MIGPNTVFDERYNPIMRDSRSDPAPDDQTDSFIKDVLKEVPNNVLKSLKAMSVVNAGVNTFEEVINSDLSKNGKRLGFIKKVATLMEPIDRHGLIAMCIELDESEYRSWRRHNSGSEDTSAVDLKVKPALIPHLPLRVIARDEIAGYSPTGAFNAARKHVVRPALFQYDTGKRPSALGSLLLPSVLSHPVFTSYDMSLYPFIDKETYLSVMLTVGSTDYYAPLLNAVSHTSKVTRAILYQLGSGIEHFSNDMDKPVGLDTCYFMLGDGSSYAKEDSEAENISPLGIPTYNWLRGLSDFRFFPKEFFEQMCFNKATSYRFMNKPFAATSKTCARERYDMGRNSYLDIPNNSAVRNPPAPPSPFYSQAKTSQLIFYQFILDHKDFVGPLLSSGYSSRSLHLDPFNGIGALFMGYLDQIKSVLDDAWEDSFVSSVNQTRILGLDYSSKSKKAKSLNLEGKDPYGDDIFFRYASYLFPDLDWTYMNNESIDDVTERLIRSTTSTGTDMGLVNFHYQMNKWCPDLGADSTLSIKHLPSLGACLLHNSKSDVSTGELAVVSGIDAIKVALEDFKSQKAPDWFPIDSIDFYDYLSLAIKIVAACKHKIIRFKEFGDVSISHDSYVVVTSSAEKDLLSFLEPDEDGRWKVLIVLKKAADPVGHVYDFVKAGGGLSTDRAADNFYEKGLSPNQVTLKIALLALFLWQQAELNTRVVGDSTSEYLEKLGIGTEYLSYAFSLKSVLNII